MNSKILVLGGKPIGSIELVKRLQERGFYTIVTDYLSSEDSPAKKIADEAWDISTAEVDTLVSMIKDNQISGIMTGVHEFNINRMLDICERTGLPSYCTRESWRYCDNKSDFKALCASFNIPTAKVHNRKDIKTEDFPLIVKPVDGSGSRGFHICNNVDELDKYIPEAKRFSPTSTVIIEDFIPYDAVIIHYTMNNGKCFYSGMSDKISVKFKNTGASVMGIQTFPSKGETEYLATLNNQVCAMFEMAGFTDGPIWIEAFYDGKDKFIFNEMGYRFGGSLTYFPVKYFCGLNQLDMMIDASVGKHSDNKPTYSENKNSKYCIIPLHIKPGKIESIINLESILAKDYIYSIVPVHHIGDTIENWGSAQQVFAYVHILYDNMPDLKEKINTVLNTLIVPDKAGENMLFTLFDINRLSL